MLMGQKIIKKDNLMWGEGLYPYNTFCASFAHFLCLTLTKTQEEKQRKVDGMVIKQELGIAIFFQIDKTTFICRQKTN